MKFHDPIIIPAIRISMGDQYYYMTTMKFDEAAKRISLVESFYKSKKLNELMQRHLNPKRAEKFARYLEGNPQRFFNSLVVGIYGGSPEWQNITLNSLDEDIDIPLDIDNQAGILILSGQEIMFAIDGQHRIAGIKKAVDNTKDLSKDDVPMIVVGDDPKTDLARTRRLFTTLNKNAKPVSTYEIIALDQDYIPAIVTRRLVEDFPLFQENISISKNKSILAKDKTSVTSLSTLYDINVLLLKDKLSKLEDIGWTEEGQVDEFYAIANEFWCAITRSYSELEEITKSNTAELRSNSGGSALFRPIGLQIIAKTILKLHSQGLSYAESANRVAKIPTELSNSPWVGLIWNASNPTRKMITTDINQKVAEQIIYYGAGGDLAAYGTTLDELKSTTLSLANRDIGKLEILRYYK